MCQIRFVHTFVYEELSGELPKPRVIVGLSRDPTVLDFVATLDSGANLSVFRGDELEPLGFDLHAQFVEGDADFQRIGTASGAEILTKAFEVQLNLGPESYDMPVWGTLSSSPQVRENVLGLDFFSRNVIALHDVESQIYLTSLRDGPPNITFA